MNYFLSEEEAGFWEVRLQEIERFNIEYFLEYLQHLNDPSIENQNIVFQEIQNIYEGIQLIYQNKEWETLLKYTLLLINKGDINRLLLARGFIAEAKYLLNLAVEASQNTEVNFRDHCLFLYYLGNISTYQSNYEEAEWYYNLALEICTKKNVGRSLYISGPALVGNALGELAIRKGKYEEAEKHFKSAILFYSMLRDDATLAEIYHNLGTVFYNKGDYIKSREFFVDSLKLNTRLENFHAMQSNLNEIANLDIQEGKFSEAQKWLELSLAVYERMNNKSKMIYILELLANIPNDYNSKKKYLLRSLSIASEIGDKKEISISYINSGNHERDNRNFEDAKIHYNKGTEIAKEIEARSLEADALRNIGIMKLYEEKYSEAEYKLKEALQIYENLKELKFISESFYQLGIIYYEWKKYNEAIEYFEKSLKFYQQVGMVRKSAELMYAMAQSLYKSQKYDDAIKLYLQSLNTSRKIKDTGGVISTLQALGSLYNNLNDSMQSKIYFEECIALCRELGSEDQLLFNLHELGVAELEMKNYLVAKKLLEESLDIARKLNDKNSLPVILENLISVSETLGETVLAESYNQERNSILNN